MANRFFIPRRIVSGVDALEEAGEQISRLGRRALIVTDSMMAKLGNLDKVTSVLERGGVGYSVFDGANTEPTDTIVLDGLDQYQRENCDFLVGLGGGSPLDTMKAIAMLAKLGGVPSDYFGQRIHTRLPDMVAIPTTAGTGSEATQFTIITDSRTDVKMLLRGHGMMPSLAVVDPQFTMTAPPAVTAATGLDALCHAIEAYLSRMAQPLSDTFALSAARRIFGHLKRAYDCPADVEARTQMAIGATEAGIAFNNSSVTIVHGMSRPIGALFHVAHGLSNAMLLEACLNFAKEGCPGRFADLARSCGFAEQDCPDGYAAELLIERIAILLDELEIPTPQEYGLDRETFFAAIPRMAQDAIDSGSPANSRRTVTVGDVEELYRSLWA